MQSGSKNPPWARSNANNTMTGINPQIMDPNSMALNQQGMMPFQQSQAVFNPGMMQTQGGMNLPMGGQMPMNQMSQGQMFPGNVVAYPTPRAMNPGMYQNSQSGQSQPNTNEQRVFTGTVTKTHNDFGFVDHDVFYQTSVCAKGIIPKVNDRVLVEATFNPNMPFKWNATRVQVIQKTNSNQNKQGMQKGGGYNAVPPPMNNKKSMPNNRRDDHRPPRREERKRSRSPSLPRSRDQRDSRRRESPVRKRPNTAVHQMSPLKYSVRVPKIPLDISSVDVPALSHRYTNLYVPSDFFSAKICWNEVFPPDNPFSLNNACQYHIMSKDVENPIPNDAVYEPSDADYRFSAKVMLISLHDLETVYQKCGLTKSDDKEKKNRSPLHPTRLIKFLVGQKGKAGENFAIGGPWSPSLDGLNPESDPSVLVKTAIRTCKALTGIDLSSCAQWYRMVEFCYWRESSGGKSRVETVVLFLPDVWSAAPARLDWPRLTELYAAAAVAATTGTAATTATAAGPQPSIDKPNADDTITIEDTEEGDEDKLEPTHYSKLDLKTIKVDALRRELRARKVSCKGLRPQLVSRLSKLVKVEEEKETKGDDDTIILEDEANKSGNNTMDDSDIKDDSKQDIEDKESKTSEENGDKTDSKTEKDTKPESKDSEEEKKKTEKELAALKAKYELPSNPHIIVHPSTTAKGGKFTCSVATLSLLLDYRITDNKEHSFELFVFAELFNEMMMRDFGFYIYKTLYTLPEMKEATKEKSEAKKDEKADDKKDDKKDDRKDDKKDDKKEDKKEEKSADKKEDRKDDKRDDKRDDRRDSKKRDRKDSPAVVGGVNLPPDPYLLLSLVYFDTGRGGHMLRRDMQNLFMSLGLRLSRSQIRPLLDKVCVKDDFSFKSLVQTINDISTGRTDVLQDLPLDTVVKTSEETCQKISELEASIATGNRRLFPVFKGPSDSVSDGATQDVSETGSVMYRGRLISIPAALATAAREAKLRTSLETALSEARAVARTMRAAANTTQASSKQAQDKLKDVSEALVAANNRVAALTVSARIFHSALKTIQAKVDAVIDIKFEEDAESVNGPAKIKNEGLKKEKEEKPRKEEVEKPVPKEEVKVTKEDESKAEDVEMAIDPEDEKANE